MRRELSSKATPLYRWVIPAALTILAILVIWRLGGVGTPGRPEAGAMILAISIAAALVVIARILDRAKRVWIEHDVLIVSDYRKEAQVRLGDVANIEATRFVKPDRVRIHFSRATIFGESVVFFPPIHWRDFASRHPVADELQSLVTAGGRTRN
ncbi:MAG: hypothetical protein QNJ73_10635 [Gammaproteobacteria bacterium]|nr:hypothetical protein [Gammaproteobacteria bacterium]